MNASIARGHQAWFICIAALLLGCHSDAQKNAAVTSQQGNEPVADIQVTNPKPYPFRFVAYGDMRFAEHEQYKVVIANAKARQAVIDQIGGENPAFLVVTGDFVFRGFHAEDWTYFDRAIKPMRDRGIQIYPAVGNHEVGPFPAKLYGGATLQEIEKDAEQVVASKGLDNYYKEFPEISHKPWYSMRYANCYFLILDSEIKDEKLNMEQDQWIKKQLDSMSSAIDYIFLAFHRPPYTALTDDVHKPGPEQIALSKLLEERAQNSRARIIVIAGHVHNYERYEHNRVTYIVSGGGGAEPAQFPRAADDLYPQNALFGKNDPVNEDQFHYCLFTVDQSKLNFKMMKLVGNGTSPAFEPRDSFELDSAAR